MNFTKLNIIIILIIFYFYFKKTITKEKFSTYSFNCISDNKFSYIDYIYQINNNLENDRFLLNKSFECEQLLNLYDVIICDFQKDDLSSLNIINYIDIKPDSNNLNYINNIFTSLKKYSEELILNISNLSNEITTVRYINPNTNILLNLKNEFILKFL